MVGAKRQKNFAPETSFSSYNNDRMSGRRRIVLICLGVLVLAVLLLSASLNGLKLQEGQLLIFTNFLPINDPMGPIPGGQLILQIIRVIYLIALIATPLMIIYLILSPKARKAFLRYLLRVLSFLLVIYLIARFIASLSAANTTNSDGLSGAQPTLLPGLVPTLPPVPSPSEGLILGLSIALAVVVTLGVLGLGWLLWRRLRRPESAMLRIAFEAQSALDDLRTGGNLKNTIMRCYYEMSKVIDEQRGIRRNRSMTPREFEGYLESSGLPGEPVRQLTHLFEDVRYGDFAVGEKEEQQAQSSLTAIIEAVKRGS